MAKVTKLRPRIGISTSTKDKLILPTKPNVPSDNLTDYAMMIFGQKGIGKTSLASQFPKSLVFMFEKRRRNLPIFQVPVSRDEELTWESFLEYLEAFIEEENFETAVIDTIDGCYMACYQSVCKRYGVIVPSESNIWDEIAAEFGAVVLMMQNSGKGIVFLSHDKAKPMTLKKKGFQRSDLELEESSIPFERMEPTCRPAGWKVIQEVCDFVFYYGFTEGYRTLTVRSPHNLHWTACGVPGRFLDPEGTPISTFKVGENPELAYKNLNAAFMNQIYDVDYVPQAKPRKQSILRRPQK